MDNKLAAFRIVLSGTKKRLGPVYDVPLASNDTYEKISIRNTTYVNSILDALFNSYIDVTEFNEDIHENINDIDELYNNAKNSLNSQINTALLDNAITDNDIDKYKYYLNSENAYNNPFVTISYGVNNYGVEYDKITLLNEILKKFNENFNGFVNE